MQCIVPKENAFLLRQYRIESSDFSNTHKFLFLCLATSNTNSFWCIFLLHHIKQEIGGQDLWLGKTMLSGSQHVYTSYSLNTYFFYCLLVKCNFAYGQKLYEHDFYFLTRLYFYTRYCKISFVQNIWHIYIVFYKVNYIQRLIYNLTCCNV